MRFYFAVFSSNVMFGPTEELGDEFVVKESVTGSTQILPNSTFQFAINIWSSLQLEGIA